MVQVRQNMTDRWRSVEVGVIQKDKIQIRTGLEKGQSVVCRTR